MAGNLWINGTAAKRAVEVKITNAADSLSKGATPLTTLSREQGPEKWGQEDGALRLGKSFATVVQETNDELARVREGFESFKLSVGKAVANTEQVDSEALDAFNKKAIELQTKPVAPLMPAGSAMVQPQPAQGGFGDTPPASAPGASQPEGGGSKPAAAR